MRCYLIHILNISRCSKNPGFILPVTLQQLQIYVFLMV